MIYKVIAGKAVQTAGSIETEIKLANQTFFGFKHRMNQLN